MLFNSNVFIFAFLPITYALFYLLGTRSRSLAAAFLVVASVVFYGWWSVRYIPLMMLSIAFNYACGQRIAQAATPRRSGNVLRFAIIVNLAALAYYKYAGFFVENLSAAIGRHWKLEGIILPLGISFFTFTQLAYLVDVAQKKSRETNWIHYALFVTYFPHLIAGPILHHSEMMPQFARLKTYQPSYDKLSSGLFLFVIGLVKKVIMADGVQPFVAPAFDGPANASLNGVEAWGGALAYTAQLYFDFSGYTDMARGISILFNIDLPINFDSPYKSASIIEFWRRWHITLSRFLRDYLYIPLGGNRDGSVARFRNMFLTMVLGGLWHGAGWTFLFWGALHGIYLIVNHGWRGLTGHVEFNGAARSAGRVLSVALTFVAVVVGWVFFRAPSLDRAWSVLVGMSGARGWGHGFAISDAFRGSEQMGWVAVLLLSAFVLPNSQQIVAKLFADSEASSPDVLSLPWREVIVGAAIGSILLLSVINESKTVSEFIYFNF